MDEFEHKVIRQYASERFSVWKEYLTPTEQAIFYDYYFLGFSLVKIATIENYSERQVSRILKTSRKKIFKHIP